jgi:hypothetical protein
MTEAGGATTLTDNQGEPTTLAPRTRGPSRVFAVPIFAMLPAQLASATNKNPKVLPPNSHAFGATYAAWNSRWWQWAASTPTPENSVVETTGRAVCRRAIRQGLVSGRNRWLRVGDADMYRPDQSGTVLPDYRRRSRRVRPGAAPQAPAEPCGAGIVGRQVRRSAIPSSIGRQTTGSVCISVPTAQGMRWLRVVVVARYLTRVILDVSLAHPLTERAVPISLARSAVVASLRT